MNKYPLNYLSIILLLQILAGCHDYSHEVKQSLKMAGDNRPELEKVLNHYAGDRQKYQAAEYLIRYMPYYSYREVLPEFDVVFDNQAKVPVEDDGLRRYTYIYLLDSVTNKGATQPGIRKYDLQELTYDYLVENIDLAFEAWQEIPEGKRASFDLFCDYILPYRNLDEPLEAGTRRYLKEKYNWVPKLLNQGTPVKTVIDSVLRGFRYRHVSGVREYYPSALSVRQFDRCRMGLCQDGVTYFVNVFRSVGLVCSDEYMPQRGADHIKGHSWIFIRYGDDEIALDAGGDGGDLRQTYIGESVPKVYRRTYARLNPSSLFGEGRDVTDFYRPVINFELDVGVPAADTMSKYTVNLYHRTKGWNPVAEMAWELDGSGKYKLICRNLGVHSLYIAGRWESGKVYPVTMPFFVKEDGDIHELRPEETLLDSVPLLRKYGLTTPTRKYKADWIRWMEGATVQGAQDSLFTRADTLFKNKNFWSTQMRTYPVNSHKSYRYVRFAPQGDTAYLAELAFYGNSGKKLEGKVISGKMEAGRTGMAVYDDDPLTWAGGAGFYVGYEFEKPKHIHSIAFQARNDDNHIREGDEYELQYWDREWKSLGKQIARDTVLYYYDVPKNALMLLKDLTRGSEEFPFRINEHKEQEWMAFDNY